MDPAGGCKYNVGTHVLATIATITGDITVSYPNLTVGHVCQECVPMLLLGIGNLFAVQVLGPPVLFVKWMIADCTVPV